MSVRIIINDYAVKGLTYTYLPINFFPKDNIKVILNINDRFREFRSILLSLR